MSCYIATKLKSKKISCVHLEQYNVLLYTQKLFPLIIKQTWYQSSFDIGLGDGKIYINPPSKLFSYSTSYKTKKSMDKLSPHC